MARSTDVDAFLDKLDFSMVIVTTASQGERAGCLVGFVSQCSMDPPRMLVCISDKNHTHEVALKAPSLAVHLIPRERKDLVELFGSTTGYEIDKFSAANGHPAPTMCPL